MPALSQDKGGSSMEWQLARRLGVPCQICWRQLAKAQPYLTSFSSPQLVDERGNFREDNFDKMRAVSTGGGAATASTQSVCPEITCQITLLLPTNPLPTNMPAPLIPRRHLAPSVTPSPAAPTAAQKPTTPSMPLATATGAAAPAAVAGGAAAIGDSPAGGAVAVGGGGMARMASKAAAA